MKIKHLEHRHGGKITDLTAIEHSTVKKDAYWEFRGRVEWNDGTVSEGAAISPVCLVHEGTADSHAELDEAMQHLTDYLRERGEWTGENHHRWVPFEKAGKAVLP